MEYSNKFGSDFPRTPMAYGTKKDVDDRVKELISQYYSYIDSGDLNSAAEICEAYPYLYDYTISSKDFNRWEEEMYNLGVALFQSRPTIISGTEPEDIMSINSHWLKEY